MLPPSPTNAAPPAPKPALASAELLPFPVKPDDVLELKQSRAQTVQRALLSTEKVTAERLFILAPLPAEGAAKGQSRVNLSLN